MQSIPSSSKIILRSTLSIKRLSPPRTSQRFFQPNSTFPTLSPPSIPTVYSKSLLKTSPFPRRFSIPIRNPISSRNFSTNQANSDLLPVPPSFLLAWRICASVHVRRALYDREVTRIVHCGPVAIPGSYSIEIPSQVTSALAPTPFEAEMLADKEEEETCFLVLGHNPAAFVEGILRGSKDWDWALEKSSILVGGLASDVAECMKKLQERGWTPVIVNFAAAYSPEVYVPAGWVCLEAYNTTYVSNEEEDFEHQT